MNRRPIRLALAVLMLSSGACAAQAPHPCAADARARATPLLKLHLADGALAGSIAVEAAVKSLPAVKALKGSGRFDVLETWGHVYKADYRLRFLYAQIKGSCVLMGQEIIEASDPY